jgi:hypothetical protein
LKVALKAAFGVSAGSVSGIRPKAGAGGALGFAVLGFKIIFAHQLYI